MQLTSRFLTVIALVLFFMQAWATPQQLQADLQQMRLSATSIMTNYYMYAGLDLDSRYKARLDQSVASFELALDSANKLADGSDLRKEVDGIAEEWAKYAGLIQANLDEMHQTGFPNVRYVNDMHEASLSIVQLATDARDALYQKSKIQPNEVIKQTRELAILMEKITAQYAALNTSNLGQVFAGNTDLNLSDMADTFTANLDKLSKIAKTPRSEDVLYSIHSKWRFMEQRIRDYNANAVVFLVVSYNDKIILHLHELEGLFL